MFLVHGRLLGSTDETINYTDKNTQQPASFRRRQLHVLSGVEVHKLDVPDNFDVTSIPSQGTDVLVKVEVYAKGGFLNVRAREFVQDAELVGA